MSLDGVLNSLAWCFFPTKYIDATNIYKTIEFRLKDKKEKKMEGPNFRNPIQLKDQ